MDQFEKLWECLGEEQRTHVLSYMSFLATQKQMEDIRREFEFPKSEENASRLQLVDKS